MCCWEGVSAREGSPGERDPPGSDDGEPGHGSVRSVDLAAADEDGPAGDLGPSGKRGGVRLEMGEPAQRAGQ